MPWYNDLRPNSGDENKQKYALLFPNMTIEEKIRCIDKLLILRTALDEKIRPKKVDENLLIASWNIKEFGHTTQRKPEAYFYIAEIINRFDLIAVQEIKSSLVDLNLIIRLLGKDWAYQINDITEGSDGNSERSAYIYNKKRVDLAGISGELILWDDLTKNSDIKQLKRAPYITGFKAGWKSLSLINLHLHPNDGNDDILYRKEEVRLLLEAIDYKFKNKRFWSENIIVLGDFNFYNRTRTKEKDEPTIALFAEKGFREIEALSGIDTNASFTEAYDRMFFNTNDFFKIQKDKDGKEVGGVFNPFEFVYTDEEVATYELDMKQDYTGTKDLNDSDILTAYYKHTWRKNQLSDHFPIWTEIVIDSSDSFLKAKKSLLEKERDNP